MLVRAASGSRTAARLMLSLAAWCTFDVWIAAGQHIQDPTGSSFIWNAQHLRHLFALILSDGMSQNPLLL